VLSTASFGCFVPRRPLARSARALPTLSETCHRRFQRWNEEGALDEILRALAEDLKDRGELDLFSECFIDGTFVGAKKRGRIGGKDQAGQGHQAHGAGRRFWCSYLHMRGERFSARGYARRGSSLAASFVRERPERLIGEWAYDSDPLDAALREAGIEMIAPQRRNRMKPKSQDGRKLRRYKRRWKIERLFAWLGNFRRLVVRYERLVGNYLGFVRLGCIVILLRYL
jgi:transposase